MMDASDIRDAKFACVELVNRCALVFDTHELSELDGLFAQDAVLILPEAEYIGLEAIREFCVRRQTAPASRHVVSNHVIEVDEDGRHARGTSYITLYRRAADSGVTLGVFTMTGPTVMGVYTDEFVLIDGRWKLGHREMRRLFAAPRGDHTGRG